MISARDVDESRALWRRQAFLVGLAFVAFVGVLVLSTLAADAVDNQAARARAGLHTQSETPLVVGAIVGGVVLFGLLVAVVVHAVRVVRFTFRRGAE